MHRCDSVWDELAALQTNQSNLVLEERMENNIGLILSKRAKLSGSTEAYVDSKSGLRLTFTELDLRCNQVANMLLAEGVQKGDRVAIMMMNTSSSQR